MVKHRINNIGRIWNGDETEGWNEAKPKGNAERFSIYIFSIRNEVKDLEFALAKLRGLCKYLASVQFTQSCLRTPPSYFCAQKQSRKINAMRRVVL